ncbi:MAG: 30S ribosomal protein S6 [Patescibacteria group bacterium]
MKHYELMYIIPAKVGVNDEAAIQEKIRAMLLENKAEITMEEDLGKRKLAYAINHLRHGTHVVIEFDLEPTNLARITNWLRLSSEILRSQILSKQKKTPEQIAREKAFQEKLGRLQAKNEADELAASAPQRPKTTTKTVRVEKTKVELDELDKRLEEILKKEIVK